MFLRVVNGMPSCSLSDAKAVLTKPVQPYVLPLNRARVAQAGRCLCLTGNSHFSCGVGSRVQFRYLRIRIRGNLEPGTRGVNYHPPFVLDGDGKG
jgi:hypothetical protein